MSRVTIKDVAKRANVSIATVSNVMNGSGRVSAETIRKVQQVIDELQFVPSQAARNLRDKNTHLIAVVVPFIGKDGRLQDNPFYWQLVSGIEVGARDQQFHVMLLGVSEDETFSFVKERDLDGLIIVGAYNESPIIDRIRKLNIPCVFMDSYLEDPELYQVLLEDETGGYLGTKHLLAQGHRRIALLCGNPHQSGVTRHRYLGYRRALEEAGIPYDPELLLEGPVSIQGGYKAAQKVGDPRKEITAVFAFSDVAAMGMIKGLYEIGIQVPQDISVVGYDDLFYVDFMIPSLTTVSQEVAERGETAVRLLLDQMDQEKQIASRRVVLPVSLKVRQSTGSARQR